VRIGSFVPLALALPAGWATWTLGEYVLHRFAMHHLRGKGVMSREHLMHHVRATWAFDPLITLAWLGVVLLAVVVWAPIGWLVAGPAAGIGLGAGWIVGYFFYEYQHARAHLRPPRNRYQRWLRRHHFHHHFGAPMANHGVTTAVWDRVFGTWQRPEQVRVPRRLAMGWLLDETGQVRPEHAADYRLVGRRRADAANESADQERAFASLAPAD